MHESVDLSVIASTLPDLPSRIVARDGIVSWLKDRLTTERRILAVTGKTGAGKSTLLAEFVHTHKDRCISYFINRDLWSQRLEVILADISAQIRSYLGLAEQRALPSAPDLILKEYDILLSQLNRGLRRTNSTLYFVIDSVDLLDGKDSSYSIVPYLPLSSRSNVFFLFSYETCPSQLTGKVEVEEYPIPPFGQVETEHLLSGLNLTASDTKQIHDVSRGLPAYICEVRRQLEDGAAAAEVLDDLPQVIAELLLRSWHEFLQSEDIRQICAILAFSREPLSVTELAEVSEIPIGSLSELIDRIPFITVNITSSRLAYINHSHENFITQRLADLRPSVEDRLLRYYQRKPESDQALLLLPQLMLSSRNWEQLKHLVDLDYLRRFLTGKRDLALLRSTLKICCLAARETSDTAAQFRFSVQLALLEAAATAIHGDQREIEVLVELREFGDAMDLALQAVTPRERLMALSIVGKGMRELGLSLPEELNFAIDAAADEVSADTPPREVTIIAALFFDIRPETALSLVERCVGTDEGRSLDQAIALLGLTADDQATAADLLHARISDEELRQFVQAHSSTIATLSADEACEQAAKLEDISARLFFLRDWCNSNLFNSQSTRVIVKAFEWITESSSYAPSLRLLRQISEPIRALEVTEARPLVERLDILHQQLNAHPEGERLRIQLLIASQEMRWAFDQGANRLLEVYLSVYTMSDLDARASLYAHVLKTLQDMGDNDDAKDLRNRYWDEFAGVLVDTVTELLSTSADQLEIMKPALRTLALVDLSLATSVAESLNTLERRERAFAQIAVSAVDAKASETAVTEIVRLSERITGSQALRAATLIRVVRGLVKKKVQLSESQLDSLVKAIRELPGAAPVALGLAWASRLYGLSQIPTPDHLIEDAVSACAAIDLRWDQVEVGFRIARAIAPVSPEKARELLDVSRERRVSSIHADPFFGSMFATTLALASSAFWGIAEKGDALESDLDVLISAIAQIPSFVMQGRLLGRVAMRLYLCDKAGLADKVAAKAITLLDHVTDEEERQVLTSSLLSVASRYAPELLSSMIEELDYVTRERAILNVLMSFVAERPPDLLIAPLQNQYILDFQRALSAVSMLGYLRHDASIADAVRQIANATIRGYREHRMTGRQVSDLIQRIESAISGKLPDHANIRHEGYSILCRASILRVHGSLQGKLPITWTDIKRDIEALPNTADKCFVFATLSEDLYAEQADVATQFINMAEQLYSSIPDAIDRIGRMGYIAQVHGRGDRKEAAKHFLTEAMRGVYDLIELESRDSAIDQLVEVANSIDPDVASSLTPLIEDSYRRHTVEDRTTSHRIERQPGRVADISRHPRRAEIVTDSARLQLGALESDRGRTQSDQVVREWLASVEGEPLQDIRVVFGWAVENARLGNWPAEVQRRLMISALEAADLVQELAKIYVPSARPVRPSNESPPAEGFLFRAGDRQAAVRDVTRWISESANEFLVICDPYFNIRDLSILRYVPNGVSVQILTSLRVQIDGASKKASALDLPRIYAHAWTAVCDIDPPETSITAVGTRTGKDPLHDRYLLTKGGGLRLGTSLNGLGLRQSEASQLDGSEADRIRLVMVNPWLSREMSVLDGEKVLHMNFDLTVD
jgi:hypothetical protein